MVDLEPLERLTGVLVALIGVMQIRHGQLLAPTHPPNRLDSLSNRRKLKISQQFA